MPTLDFKGKQHIYAHHLTVPYRPLVPDAERSLNPGDADDNLIIHGDNLHALKALLPRYAGRVKCIYIDPPYNTGNESWIYNDRVNSPLMKAWLKENGPVDNEDLERHDKWLCMMWPRLHLLKELLSEDGVIFISIDDNEQHHLRMMMDEIFGERNFVANIIWNHRKSSQNDIDVSLSHNHIVCYANDRSSFSFNAGDVDESKFSNPDNDRRGPWVADPMDAPNIRENLTYEIVNPNTSAVYLPPAGRHWRFTRENHDEALADNRIIFGRSGRARPQYKRFLSPNPPKRVSIAAGAWVRDVSKWRCGYDVSAWVVLKVRGRDFGRQWRPTVAIWGEFDESAGNSGHPRSGPERSYGQDRLWCVRWSVVDTAVRPAEEWLAVWSVRDRTVFPRASAAGDAK